MSCATTVPRISPKVVAEKARSEKPLSSSSMAIISQPNPKPATIPNTALYGTTTNSGRTWLTAKPPIVHMARNNNRMIQSAIIRKWGPEASLGELLGRLQFTLRQRLAFRRFVLPQHPPKAQPVQITGCNAQILGNVRHIGRNSLVAEQFPRQTFARLDVAEQAF